MARYLIASDYDGTLKRWPDDVTEEDKEAIRRFRRAGNYFIIISGRVYESLNLELDNNGFRDVDMLMYMSGSLVSDNMGKVIVDFKGNSCIVGDLLRDVLEMGAYVALVAVGEVTYTITDFAETPYGIKIDIAEAEKLPYFTSISCNFKTVELAMEAAEVLRAKYCEYANILQNSVSLDIPPANINKGISVGRVADMLGVDHNNVYTVGDNFNDIDMLRAFHGRARENAADEVCTAAEKCFSTIAEIVDEILEMQNNAEI